MNKPLTQIITFVLVGMISFSTDLIFYLGFQSVLDSSASNAKIFSYILGSIVSFILNKKYTFKIKSKGFSYIILFCVVYLISLFFNSIIHDTLMLFVEKSYAFIIAYVVSVVINFIGQRELVFKEK